MKKIIVERILKLLSVKSLVTLSLTGALCALLFGDRNPPQELLALFCTSYGAIMTYFFTREEDTGKVEKDSNN